MKIEFVKPTIAENIDFLGRGIDEDMAKVGQTNKIEHISFFIKNNDKEILGGCNGFTICGSIYTDQLWIHESLRSQGFGRKLMENMHDYGRSLGLKLATVQTMSFQAKRGFYEHLGYKCDFERYGYSNNVTLICMRKEL